MTEAATAADRPAGHRAIEEFVYPERRFGGFSRWDGTLAFLNRVHALLPDAGTVLDIGCGRGEASEDRCAWRRKLADLRAPGRHVVGIDVDPAGRANPIIDEFRPIAADFRWPVEDASVDCAVARSVLEHVPDPGAFFSELVRVLRPGGVFCAHTPNRWGYPALGASLVPNRLHAKVLGSMQADRQERDVFPTLYRMNTGRALRRLAVRHGLDCVVFSWEADPSYLGFSAIAYRIGALAHRLIPAPFRTVLFVWMRKAQYDR